MLLEKYTTAEWRGFNVDFISALADPVQPALSRLHTPPMMDQQRVVFINDAQAIKEPALTLLKNYIQNPSRYSYLVLEAEEMDSKAALHKLITKHGAVIDFIPLRGPMLVKWVDNYIRRSGYSAELSVIQKLVDLTGGNLYAVTNELAKLFTYLSGGSGREITQELIAELTIRSRQNTVFELTDAIGRKQRKKALLLLQHLIRDGEDPLGILAMMARHFRQLLMVKEMINHKASTREILSRTQIRDFLLEEFMRQAKNFTDEEAVRSYRRMAEADGLFKGAGLHAQSHLEWIICCATR